MMTVAELRPLVTAAVFRRALTRARDAGDRTVYRHLCALRAHYDHLQASGSDAPRPSRQETDDGDSQQLSV